MPLLHPIKTRKSKIRQTLCFTAVANKGKKYALIFLKFWNLGNFCKMQHDVRSVQKVFWTMLPSKSRCSYLKCAIIWVWDTLTRFILQIVRKSNFASPMQQKVLLVKCLVHSVVSTRVFSLTELTYFYTASGKKDLQSYANNFNKFKRIFTISGTHYLDDKDM